jgi:hypothetical protein
MSAYVIHGMKLMEVVWKNKLIKYLGIFIKILNFRSLFLFEDRYKKTI